MSFVLDAVRELVLSPQSAVSDPDLVAYMSDEGEVPLDAAVLEIAPEASRPIAADIGGGGQIEHIVSVLVAVEDGDPERGERRRDGILLDLVLRLEAEKSLQGWESEDGRQYVEAATWRVDYGATALSRSGADADPSAIAAYAVLVVTVRATLNR